MLQVCQKDSLFHLKFRWSQSPENKLQLQQPSLILLNEWNPEEETGEMRKKAKMKENGKEMRSIWVVFLLKWEDIEIAKKVTR
jgi:hypothetical protein